MKSLPYTIWKTTNLFILSILVFGQGSAAALGSGSADRTAEEIRDGVMDLALSRLEESRLMIKNTGGIEKISIPKKNLKKGGWSKEAIPPSVMRTDLIDCDIKGSIRNRFYVDTVENNFEDTRAMNSWLTLESKIRFPNTNVTAFVSVDARSELTGDDGYNAFNPEALLNEAYVQIKENKWKFRLGKQLITWGKLDEVSLLDIVNPQDLTESILLDRHDRKRPIWMAKADYYGEKYYVESFIAPWFRPHDIDFFGTDWAFFRYIKKGVEKGEYTEGVKQTVSGIAIEDYDKSRSFKNSEFGIRFGGRVRDIDYSLYYMNIHNRVPSLKEYNAGGRILKAFLYDPNARTLANLAAAGLSGNGLKLTTGYNRMSVLGADFETTMGQFGVRGEAGLFLSPTYLTKDFSVTERETLSLGFGIDHTTAEELYLNLQLIGNLILDYGGLFNEDRLDRQLVLIMSKDFLRGKLVPSLYCGYNFSDRDIFFNPEITYELNGSMDVSVGAFLFNGGADTAIGRFDDNDCFYTTAEYKF